MSEDDVDRQIRRNREEASAIGIVCVGIIGLTIAGTFILWGLHSIGLNIPPEVVGLRLAFLVVMAAGR